MQHHNDGNRRKKAIRQFLDRTLIFGHSNSGTQQFHPWPEAINVLSFKGSLVLARVPEKSGDPSSCYLFTGEICG